MEAILTWGITHWPYVVFLLLCVGFAVWATCKVSTFYHTRFTPMEKDISNMQLDITNIRGSVDRIEKYLIDENPKAAYSALVKARSPKSLTDLGSSLLTDCGGRKFVDDNLDLLIGEIGKASPKSPLDVETMAIDALLRYTDSADFIPIKDFIYNNPNYKEVSIQLYSVINVMSVYLRDKYFERYPASQESGSL